MYVLSIEFGLHTPRKCLHLCIHLQGAGMKMSTSRGSVSLIACSATCCCSASSMCVASDDLQANQATFDTTCDKYHLSRVVEKGGAHSRGASQRPMRRRCRANTLAEIAVCRYRADPVLVVSSVCVYAPKGAPLRAGLLPCVL